MEHPQPILIAWSHDVFPVHVALVCSRLASCSVQRREGELAKGVCDGSFWT